MLVQLPLAVLLSEPVRKDDKTNTRVARHSKEDGVDGARHRRRRQQAFKIGLDLISRKILMSAQQALP